MNYDHSAFVTADFQYDLPADLIAQVPLAERDKSRLLVCHRASRSCEHRHFEELTDFLGGGDVLVINNSRVIPARLRGVRASGGGHFEILLLRENAPNDWWVMLRPGKRVRPGSRLIFSRSNQQLSALEAVVIEKNLDGHCRLEFQGKFSLWDILSEVGEIPLPPYITRPPNSQGIDDVTRYQTVYAVQPGSVAAPTAGLHFTEPLMQQIQRIGAQFASVTLHVGPGTFAPVKTRLLSEHRMHEEFYELSPESAEIINHARQEHRRIIAVGTTSVRVLESIAAQQGKLVPGQGSTRLFIHPPYEFRIVDGLITNFHLPQSTLLMLVCAFASPGGCAGRDWILSTYQEAVRQRYRFFSYGDATLII